MASVLDQLPNSRLSLEGNNLTATPSPFNTTNPSWGYADSSVGMIPNPDDSELHRKYSVNGNPDEMIIEPWVQTKVAQASLMINGVHDYMVYKKPNEQMDTPMTFPNMSVDVNTGQNV